MSLIEKREAVDVFVNKFGNIAIAHPDLEQLVEIHPEDAEKVIAAIKESVDEALQFKKEIADAALQEQ